MRRSLILDTHASSCYFRTSVGEGERKALVQITERCNLHCAHCFVSSTAVGGDISLADFAGKVLPRLRAARVERITLTGGEPFIHPAPPGHDVTPVDIDLHTIPANPAKGEPEHWHADFRWALWVKEPKVVLQAEEVEGYAWRPMGDAPTPELAAKLVAL